MSDSLPIASVAVCPSCHGNGVITVAGMSVNPYSGVRGPDPQEDHDERCPDWWRDGGCVNRAALVYVLDCDHAVKVGITVQTIEQRVDDLSRGSGLVDIRVVRTWQFDTRGKACAVEGGAHWLLRETRTVGEWFHCHPLDACAAVEECIRHGVPLEARFGEEEAANIRAALAARAAA